MKRNLLSILLLIIYLSFCFTMNVCAATYSPNNTDLSIDLDENIWYVFTRDNLSNNPQLDELGISEAYLKAFFDDNNVYLNAAMFIDGEAYLEFVVAIKPTEDPGTNDLDEELLLELAKGVADVYTSTGLRVDNYEVFSASNHNWININCYDSSSQLYLRDYLFLANGNGYTFKAQKSTPFAYSDIQIIEDIVETIKIKTNNGLSEKSAATATAKSIFRNILEKAVTGGISGAVIVALVSLWRFIKKKLKKDNSQCVDTPQYTYTDDEIRAYTQRYNNAFLILKDFNNGQFRNISFESNQVLIDYIFNIIPLCLGWGVFHGNKDKKVKAITEAFRFLDDLIESAPEEMAEEAAKLNATKIYYNGLDKMMVKYKKEVIDPAYIQDKSTENYNKLLTDFLKYICRIYPKIEWYDGIVEDFKHCMDEE